MSQGSTEPKLATIVAVDYSTGGDCTVMCFTNDKGHKEFFSTETDVGKAIADLLVQLDEAHAEIRRLKGERG